MTNGLLPRMNIGAALFLLFFSIAFPSLGVVQKYLGLGGVFAYCVVVALILFAAAQPRVIAWFERLSTPTAALVVVALLMGMLLLFVFIYPLVNTGLPGLGSDRDDALNMATRALLRGEYPYQQLTYLGNPITPLPGALLLAAPFVLMGNSACQTVFWLGVFAYTVSSTARMSGYAPWMLTMLVMLSPALWQDFLTGGDLLANALYVCVFAMWLLRAAVRPDASASVIAALSVVLGIGLASRPHFILILPLVFALIARYGSYRRAAGCLVVCSVSMAVLIVPFYLHDPHLFSPLHVVDKLAQFETVLPYSRVWLPVLLMAFALVVAVRANGEEFFARAAFVLALPVLGAVVLNSVAAGEPFFALAAHGLGFQFFGVIAASAVLYSSRNAPSVTSLMI